MMAGIANLFVTLHKDNGGVFNYDITAMLCVFKLLINSR